jgi:thiamine biosynthesis protein ThiI
MYFIIKLFPEITIKSPPVRKRFIKHLRENLRGLIKPIDERIVVTREWDKIEVRADISAEEAAPLIPQVSVVLSNTPGIANFALVRPFPLGDLDDIYQKTQSIWGEALAGKTFCVRAKRAGNATHDFTSSEVERYVGGGLNVHTEAAGVKLKNPDITVKLEITQDELFVVETLKQGLGGYPLGSQDPVLSLISGGFDSTVSSYMMMKRGMRTHFCFFNLGGRAHEVAVKEVAYYLWSKYGASHRVMFVTVPFEDVVGEILQQVDNSQMGVILKRMMLRAADKVAEEMDLQALVTGEAIAQVSSQTLTNLKVIDSVTDTLVLRPLVVMDKTDIIKLSRQIGTEEFCANIPEYCGVISRKPTTRARMEKVEREEARFNFDVLDKAVADRRMVRIDQVVNDLDEEVQVDVSANVAGNQVVIDVRHPDEEELKPLRLTADQVEGELAECEVLKIPFYSLSGEFGKLDQDKEYLLYCEKGVMSQLHAAHMKDAGTKNIGVFRPEK